MKKIEAVIRHYKLEDVKNALTRRPVAHLPGWPCQRLVSWHRLRWSLSL